MKKIFAFLMFAVLLSAVSCNKEQGMAGTEEMTISYTVVAGDALTKAYYGDGTLATQLSCQVFRKDVVDNAEVWTPVTPTTLSVESLGTSPASWLVTMKLAKSYTFRVAFWAQSESVPAGAFDITDLRAVAVDYSKFALNNDNLDVFCNYAEVAVTGSLSQDVILYRPLAQVNVLATDYADYVATAPSAEAEALKVAMTIENVPNTLNVVTKATSGDDDLVIDTPAAVVGGSFMQTGYYYLAMAYVLGNQEEALADNTAVAISNTTQDPLASLSFSNMPFRANYRTNIIGQLLCGTIRYHVVIEPAFETPDYEVNLTPVVATQEELAAALAVDGAVVTLSDDIALDRTMVVPEGVSVTLDMNGKTFSNTEDIWDESTGSWSMISVRGGSLTITGNGTFQAKANDEYALDVCDGGTLNIESGVFAGNITAVYAYDGFVNISGGEFSIQQLASTATDKYRFTLNCLDAAYASGAADITVTGGRFFMFDPANNLAEGAGTSFVPDGYASVADGDWFVVE